MKKKISKKTASAAHKGRVITRKKGSKAPKGYFKREKVHEEYMKELAILMGVSSFKFEPSQVATLTSMVLHQFIKAYDLGVTK